MIGRGSVKGKCNSKKQRKEFMRVLFGRRGVHFLAKKCYVKCAKSHATKGMQIAVAMLGKKTC